MGVMIPAFKGLFQGIIGMMMPVKHYCICTSICLINVSPWPPPSLFFFSLSLPLPPAPSHLFPALPYTMENHSRLGKGENHVCRTLAVHLQMYCPRFMCCLRFTSPVSCERISSGQESEMYSWGKAVLMFSSYTVTVFTQLKHVGTERKLMVSLSLLNTPRYVRLIELLAQISHDPSFKD